ncbi:hypothetical protein DFH28DRAFT_915827 [Melampsora americana]|nr:hypothetical protein DFH28DRAFT_915827 [Melampsora americana]
MSERDVPMQGIHTNNFTESYHRVLKYNFLNRHTLRRPDDTIQVLVDTAEPDFRQSTISTSLGFRPQRSTKYQNISKGLADSYSDQDLQDLGVNITQHGLQKWVISSFTRPNALTYIVHTTPPKDGTIGSINNCTCPHYAKSKSACKHMYVIARQNSYRIHETTPEIDDGHSLFVPRGITQPFNLVVRTITSIHPESPPPSPPSHPYRSSSGMAQTPSTTGLPGGSFQYMAMVPAPLPYSRPTTSETDDTAHRLSHPREEHTTSSTSVYPETGSHWLNQSTPSTTGRTENFSASHADHPTYDPHHLQSTPPAAPAYHTHTFSASRPAPYPPTPLGSLPTLRPYTRSTPAFDFTLADAPERSNQLVPAAGSVGGCPLPRHHPYANHTVSVTESTTYVPPPPPSTQAEYKFDYNSLWRHLQPHVPRNVPAERHLPSSYVRSPEVTPAPVTTSQLDGLFCEMEAGPRPINPPATPEHRHFLSPASHGLNDSAAGINRVSPGIYDGSPLTQNTSSHAMEATTTNQSITIDHGPSTLTELEVEAMNAAELAFYKKKDDLTELLKTLRQINNEAPFNDEVSVLNRVSPQLIAAMRQRAAQFLTTLRAFNSTNRPSKQRR